jgi:hypothetical protein
VSDKRKCNVSVNEVSCVRRNPAWGAAFDRMDIVPPGLTQYDIDPPFESAPWRDRQRQTRV